MSKTLFEKIIDGEIPGDIVFEDDQCVAFRDINPTAPMHILLVPRKPIPRLCDATDEDAPVLGHMLRVAPQIAESQGLGDAFRLVINNGEKAGQTVFHLHLHIIGGRSLSWPPG
ncbi:protein kinase C inhibitor [Oceanococcus atlanticus]|uniref:Protein kinase C inhibitor n=1 Tax=Oceanococcus atlanticus TaxID=1317117 RepID=A0A1Y1SH06_9GAMM|nr:histidine triad nucleotide-binding protein [Oceanococcus atlanticus]ORE88581.1 protein kinase C inhibitor [Oceanococcus atlanticus]RZO84138.1 MAG: histidine triad nucleotide-binding protein [Oceanococcus sp.]